MISPISFSSRVNPIYNNGYNLNVQAAGRTLGVGQGRAAMPETPVTPVHPTPVVSINTAQPRTDLSSPMWVDSYPREQANRSRVQYLLPQAYQETSAQPNTPGQDLSPFQWPTLPSAAPAELAARMRVQFPEESANTPEVSPQAGDSLSIGAEGAQRAAEEGRCQTCEERKYQDGSDDSSVSYQTPTHIDPDAAPAAVRGHEMEHVSHEQAKAQQEGRKVVSQTVTMHTDICPECGRVYVSGGTTQTVTKADSQQRAQEEEQEAEINSGTVQALM